MIACAGLAVDRVKLQILDEATITGAKLLLRITS